MANAGAINIVVDPFETRDFNCATDVHLRCTPLDFSQTMLAAKQSLGGEDAADDRQRAFAAAWLEANAAAAVRVDAVDVVEAGFEGAFVRRVAERAPEGSCLFAANSMSVRALDTFYAKGGRRLTVLCNRGLNGIDGTVSTALGAAQQTLQQMGIDANGAALSCAVAYPLGVVGVILAVVFLRKLFVRPCDMPGPDAEHKKNLFIASYHLTNPAVFGKSVHEIATQSHHHFVISRLWRDGRVSIPTSDKTLQENDVILVITTPGEADALRLIFGEQETKDWNTENIDWNAVDSQLISQRILVTRPEINGKKLSQLRLRNTYGINISRVYRSGVQLLATPDLRLQLGDRLTVVGEAEAIRNVEKILGNAVKSLNEPNLAAVFIGLILGTLPSLWAEAGAQGRGRGAYLSCAASFLALSAVLLYAQYGAFYTMRPGFLGFLFCGLLWGLSLIVPGMTSSSILMAVGLFTPMAEGFARLDMAVILPWLLGMALIVLTLARVVNWCFRAHYPLFYHAVFGIVLASTVVIIPLHYDGARDVLTCLLAAALGALAAYLSAKLQPKEDA